MTSLPGSTNRPLPLPPGEGRGEAAPARPGFTIVELLVVAGLIAVLAALVTPAVIRARSAARNAAIKAEIDMLHMAIMTYRNEYGSFPPCVSTTGSGSPMVKHLQRIFPRVADVPAHLTAAGAGAITPQNAIVSWLSGYTLDPTSPLMPADGRKRLYDFDRSRISSNGYTPPGRAGSPYVYVDAPRYGTVAIPLSHAVVTTSGSTNYTAQIQALTSGTNFFNPDSFQILCAGQDGIWNNDDDLSNFWRGTRAQHAASSQ